jgi:hypothetical protein
MIEDMSLRNLAPRTQEAYIRGCKKLAAFLRRSPDTATAEEYPALSTASRRAGSEHLLSQPHDHGRGLPVPGDAETA